MQILHLTRTIPALVPRYVSRFSCIGPLCEDTCCTGWHVAIDKKTFTSYRQSRHPTLARGLAKHVVRNRSVGTSANYARIALDSETATCPLMEDRLCSVHRELGESHLSDTCFSYPRTSRVFGGRHEQGLTLSCPEAARQALLAPDAFEFVEGTITVRAETVKSITSKSGLSLDIMNEVRIFCMNVIRTGELELWQRLAVLGIFCESLASHLTAGKHAEVPALIESYIAMIQQGTVQDALGELQADHGAQAIVFSYLWSGRRGANHSTVQNGINTAIIEGLGIDPETGRAENEQLISNYVRGIQRLPDALKSAPFLLENYLMNEMFLYLFPFDGKTAFDAYLKLVSRFCLVRLMLAAQCNTDAPLPDVSRLVQTVHTFCRRFQHDAKFARQTDEALSKTGMSSLAKLYTFLRT